MKEDSVRSVLRVLYVVAIFWFLIVMAQSWKEHRISKHFETYMETSQEIQKKLMED